MKLVYVRFGDIPPGENSKNYLTGKTERGVSVYEAIMRDNKVNILMPSLTYSCCVSLSGVLDRPMHILTGKVVGIGSDGEPLLIDIREDK